MCIGGGMGAAGLVRGPVTTVDGKDEFGSLLAAFAESEDETVRQQTEARIWQRYGTRGVVFISDMCGFSRTTRTYGICHFLCHIERARRIIAPEVLRHGGRLLKFEIDNSFAFFNDIDSALLCARDLTLRVEEFNARGNRATRSRSPSASTKVICS